MGGISSFADRIRGLQDSVSFRPPEQYQQSPGMSQGGGYGGMGQGGYAAFPGQGYGGFPGRFQGGFMGGYNYGSPYGFGGSGFGMQGFSPWGYGPGSYSPYGAGMMGFGGGSGMMGGPMRPYSGFDYNQWSQSQVGDVGRQAPIRQFDPQQSADMTSLRNQVAQLQQQLKAQQPKTNRFGFMNDSDRGR